ncbi:hypothetical protein SAMN05216223_101434 [Actinacidiphila yanglinensis]|uniref:Uncharacterized protein n=1 Tax=Actinacidiphila yanglinensis TaxID=310779 RepID=A0A1H5TAW8_9ACTN|nr:hypothetical protein [Actinacidiphila yanglinensis]SEF59231.1 hypothetical protein SAMN05216223_101434 [Actinacidiphila yanglinensis]
MDGFVFGEFRVVAGGRGRGVRLECVAPGNGGRDEDGAGGDAEAAGRGARLPRRRANQPFTGAVGILVGREEQLQMVRGAVRSRRMVEFTGECGIGKTALLCAVAPDAYIRVGATDLEDFLQDMVREFYEYPPGAPRLSTDECRRALERVGAVVALDDVAYGPAQIADLRAVLRGSAVLVGAARPGIGRLGMSHPMPGLAVLDAVTLLARDLGRIVSESELPDVRVLATAVGGSPLALRQAAALVRHEGRSFAELAGAVTADPGVLDELAIAALDPESKRALAVLALLGGAHLPSRLVAAMAEVPPAAERFDGLCTRGLAERHGDRFGLSAGRPEAYLRLLHRHLDFGVALRVLGSWIEARDPKGTQAHQAAAAAVPLLDTAAGRGEWDTVLELATTVEQVLCFQGHWRAWQRVLDIGRIAARELPDLAAEAHFAHQEGTLHLLEGRREAAEDALTHALGLRRRLGDTAAEEGTRANLALAMGGTGRAGGETGKDGAAASGVLRAMGGRWAGRSGSHRAAAKARRRRRALVGAVAVTAVLAAGVAVAVGAVGPGGLGGVGGSGSHDGVSADGPQGDAAASGGPPGAHRSHGGSDTMAAPGGSLPTTPGVPADPAGPLKPLTIKGAGDFGQVHARPATAPVTHLTITNPNSRPVALDAISVSAGSDFQVTAGTCRTGKGTSSGFVDDTSGGGPTQAKGLAADSSCSVTVRFTPSTLGLRAGSLTVGYGDGAKATAHLSGRSFATVQVTVTPDTQGVRHGYVDIVADGATTRCDKPAACTVRYFTAKGPVTLTAHGDPVADGTGDSGGSGDTGGSGDAGGSGTQGDSGTGDDPGDSGSGASGSGDSQDSGGSAGSGGDGTLSYQPDTWSGPCAGSAGACDPTPGGDITTTVHFAPAAG